MIAERSGGWADAMRVELAATGVRLWETGPRPELPEIVAEAPGSFLVFELTPKNAAWLLDALVELQQCWPRVRAAVVADRSLHDWQWLMREAGAVHFVTSPRQLAPLADLACRHLAAAPVPQQTFSERIWANLPWGEPAHHGPRPW